jgi:hypothetical protein
LSDRATRTNVKLSRIRECLKTDMVHNIRAHTIFPDPAFIVKRELMWIPMFGWRLWPEQARVEHDRHAGSGTLGIDVRDSEFVFRFGAGKQAMAVLNTRARGAFEQGRQIIIFPEGTRRPPGVGGLEMLPHSMGFVRCSLCANTDSRDAPQSSFCMADREPRATWLRSL